MDKLERHAMMKEIVFMMTKFVVEEESAYYRNNMKMLMNMIISDISLYKQLELRESKNICC